MTGVTMGSAFWFGGGGGVAVIVLVDGWSTVIVT